MRPNVGTNRHSDAGQVPLAQNITGHDFARRENVLAGLSSCMIICARSLTVTPR